MSMSKKKYNQPKFCLVATLPRRSFYKTILIWDGRNHLAVTFVEYLLEAAAGQTVTPETATGKNKDLIATMPVQTPYEYHVPMWHLILSKDLG